MSLKSYILKRLAYSVVLLFFALSLKFFMKFTFSYHLQDGTR